MNVQFLEPAQAEFTEAVNCSADRSLKEKSEQIGEEKR